jgi:hypothetical protein
MRKVRQRKLASCSTLFAADVLSALPDTLPYTTRAKNYNGQIIMFTFKPCRKYTWKRRFISRKTPRRKESRIDIGHELFTMQVIWVFYYGLDLLGDFAALREQLLF